jgi:signal transduction histidine kinase
VVVNLLSNALKFCSAEKGLVEIELVAKSSFVVLSIRDNGPGIPHTMLGHIFEKFTQLHSKELGKPQGTGLGLFITKSIVEQHKGQIRVESDMGKGALFEVKLPINGRGIEKK